VGPYFHYHFQSGHNHVLPVVSSDLFMVRGPKKAIPPTLYDRPKNVDVEKYKIYLLAHCLHVD